MDLNDHFFTCGILEKTIDLQVGYEGKESIEKTDDITCYSGIDTGDTD